MANTISYGLEFKVKDLDMVAKKAKELDASFAKIANSTGFKNLNKQLQEMNKLFANTDSMQKMLINNTKNETTQQSNLNKQLQQRAKYERDIADQIKRQGGGGSPTPRNSSGSGSSRTGNGKNPREAVTNPAIRAGKYLVTATAFYQGLGALKTGRDAIIDYDQALNDTYMAIGKVTTADKELLKTITQNSEYTQKYGKSFVDLAKSMEVLIKAGFNVSESTAILEPSLQLAAAGGMELEDAAKALTQSLRNMGRPMGDAQEMADLLASAAAGSAIDVKDLITSLQGAGAVAKNFGTNSKELITWLGAMGNVGLKGKEAGNAFNRVWLRLTKLTPQVEKLYALKGIKLYDDADKLRKFTDIINDVANASISLQDKQKLLGIHALKSADQIMSALPSYSQLAVVMENVSGSAEKMAGMKMEGLQSEIDKMKGTWDNIFVTQNGITESMRLMAKYLTGALETFANNPALTKAVLTLGAGGVTALFTPGGVVTKAAAGGFAAGGMLATIWDSDSDKVKDAMAKLAKEKAKTEAEAKVFREREEDLKAMTLDDLKEELKLLNQKSKLIEKDAIFYKQKADEQTAWIYKNQEQLTVANQESTWKDIDKLDAKSAGKRNELTPISLEINAVRALIGQFNQKSLMNDGGGKATKDNSRAERLKWLTALSKQNLDDEKKAIKELDDISKQREDERADRLKYLGDLSKQNLEDEKKAIEEINDLFLKREEVRKKYQGVGGKLNDLQTEMNEELALAVGNEELQTNIKKEYAQQRIDIAADAWAKEHEFAMAAFDGIKAGSSSLGSALSDDLQISKEESEQIWNSMKSTAINAFAEILIQQGINYVKGLFFQSATVASGVAIAGTLSAAYYPAALLASIMSFGTAPAVGLSALTAAMAGGSAINMLGGGAGSLLKGAIGGGGFPIADAVVANGKVYPYRKDDLVMIGTNLDNRSGASLPPQAGLPQGNSNNGSNAALISELRSLRLAVIQSDISNQKAIADNTPVIQGTLMDDVAVYKASQVGKRKSNFIVSPT
jgi:TP901 family phage tail tape measure protein